MKEFKKPKTNVEHVINAIIRADQEEMVIVKNGDPNIKGYIVIHGNTGYMVKTTENGEISHCTCAHHTFRNVICKHMIKVALAHGLSVADLPEVTGKEVKNDNEKVTVLKAE